MSYYKFNLWESTDTNTFLQWEIHFLQMLSTLSTYVFRWEAGLQSMWVSGRDFEEGPV